ncbi:MAG: Holliday junction resolvase RuvX [Betaproteobacteria bacterium]
MTARGRILGVDWGLRRIGLAISDASGTLARPLRTLRVSGFPDALAQVAAETARLSEDEDGLAGVVVGLPRRLDGTPTAETPQVEAFVAALRERIRVPIVLQDERLSSQEAESRLAVGERDWRARKARLDAAAAAVILQDYLDRRA